MASEEEIRQEVEAYRRLIEVRTRRLARFNVRVANLGFDPDPENLIEIEVLRQKLIEAKTSLLQNLQRGIDTFGLYADPDTVKEKKFLELDIKAYKERLAERQTVEQEHNQPKLDQTRDNSGVIQQQRNLLAAHRFNLHHLVLQAARYGGEEDAPVKLMNDLRTQRAHIRRIKANLAQLGSPIDDHPDDEPPDLT